MNVRPCRKTISEQNLRTLIDTLVGQKTRVVGPKADGPVVLYAPLAKGEELVLDEQPRRSAKESFFPLCETILTYEKGEEGTTVADIDPARFPETVLVGARPCDAAGAPVLDAVFSWDYDDPFFLERRKKTTVIGLACTRADEACFCTAVGLSPGDPKGSDLFLTPLAGRRLRLRSPQRQGGGAARGPCRPLRRAGRPPSRCPWPSRRWAASIWTGSRPGSTAISRIRCGRRSPPAAPAAAACAFLCPVCHCFDIVDEGSAEYGVRGARAGTPAASASSPTTPPATTPATSSPSATATG